MKTPNLPNLLLQGTQRSTASSMKISTLTALMTPQLALESLEVWAAAAEASMVATTLMVLATLAITTLKIDLLELQVARAVSLSLMDPTNKLAKRTEEIISNPSINL